MKCNNKNIFGQMKLLELWKLMGGEGIGKGKKWIEWHRIEGEVN